MRFTLILSEIFLRKYLLTSKIKDQTDLHVDSGPVVEEGGGGVGVARPGGQVEGSVAAQVQLVQLQPLLRHLLAEPARDTVLQGRCQSDVFLTIQY